MAASRMDGVIQHLRGAVLLRDGAGLTDEQLLTNYISRRDEAALAALVHRHGPMVWGVCRRSLANHHDAEDAFQATFLVLVRRAASITSRGLLANWLYGVAHRTAVKARATAARRRDRETQVGEMPESAVAEHDPWNDLRPLLDQELSRLPDRYRVVIVLCDLDGRTRTEAARQLGLPEGTVGSRLARARAMLAKRLGGRGVVVSAGALAATLAQNVAPAGVPAALVTSTIRVSVLAATGQAVGVISAHVATLTEGVLKAMFLKKLMTTAVVLQALGLAALAFGSLAIGLPEGTGRPADTQPAVGKKPADVPAKKDDAKNGVPALAKEVVKMKVVRVTNEKRDDDRAEKTIEGKEKIGQLLALFPEVGTDKRPDNALLRASGASYQITLEREKGKGDPLYITISGNRQFWVWSQGTALPKGDWNLKNAKEVGKFLDELLDPPAKELVKKELPVLAEEIALAAVARLGGQALRDEAEAGRPVWSVRLIGKDVKDADIKDLAGFKQLGWLTLHDAPLTDACLKDVARFEGLYALSLRGTKVTDACLKEIARVKGLIYLCLGETKVTDAGLKELASLKELKTLLLDGARVTDDAVGELARLEGLTLLNLTDTKLTDAGVEKLQSALPKCRITR